MELPRTKGLYWCGVLDPALRVFDIIMLTEFGTTYNAYLLKSGGKTVLFETVKERFSEPYFAQLDALCDLESVEYLIISHTEPDHTGSIEQLLSRNPNIKLVGTASAISFLKLMVGCPFESIAVKEGDSIDLGEVTLRFMPLPNLHWPDTMFTYIDGLQALVTCDAFGAHYSFEGVLKSNVTDETGYQRALKYYFDNIIGPFKKPFMQNALARIKDLDIDMILTGHGPVLDCDLPQLLRQYDAWTNAPNPNTKKTVVMPYVSAYGFTAMLAEAIERGIAGSGDIAVRRYDMVTADFDAVMAEIDNADGLLFGTPTIVGDALEPIWRLVCAMHSPVHRGKLAAAFGSYGWSGEGVPNITERLRQLKLNVLEGYRTRFKPDEAALAAAQAFGYNFGCTLLGKENDRVGN